MTQDKFNTYWTQSWTEKQQGKPTRYRIGYGSNRNGDGDAGEVCNIETDDKVVVDFIVSAPIAILALRDVADEIPLYPNAHGGKYMITLSQEEVDDIRRALAKARGEL